MKEGIDSNKDKDLSSVAQKTATRFILTVVFIAISLVAGIMVAINQLNLSFIYVSGTSMHPDLENGDIVVIKYEEYVNNGQVAVFRQPAKWREYNGNDSFAYGDESNTVGGVDNDNSVNSDNTDAENVVPNTYMIKDIVAVVGQELEIDKEGIKVEGEKVFDFDEENYTCQATEDGSSLNHTLSDQELFVMGTNTQVSFDSLRVYCNYSESNMFLNGNEVSQHGNLIKVL